MDEEWTLAGDRRGIASGTKAVLGSVPADRPLCLPDPPLAEFADRQPKFEKRIVAEACR